MKDENTRITDKEITAENLAKVIFENLREEIVAVCSQDGNKINVRFPNGKPLLISVEEC